MDGINLRPVWEGRKSRVRDSVFLSFKGVQRAVRDDRWKLIRYPEINHTQLFDLENDPDELKNLAADPGQAKCVPRCLPNFRDGSAMKIVSVKPT